MGTVRAGATGSPGTDSAAPIVTIPSSTDAATVARGVGVTPAESSAALCSLTDVDPTPCAAVAEIGKDARSQANDAAQSPQ
jgi:hypothetical protein